MRATEREGGREGGEHEFERAEEGTAFLFFFFFVLFCFTQGEASFLSIYLSYLILPGHSAKSASSKQQQAASSSKQQAAGPPPPPSPLTEETALSEGEGDGDGFFSFLSHRRASNSKINAKTFFFFFLAFLACLEEFEKKKKAMRIPMDERLLRSDGRQLAKRKM